MGCSLGKSANAIRSGSIKVDGQFSNSEHKMEHSTLIHGLRYNMVKLKQVKLEDLYTVLEGELGLASMGCTVRKIQKKGTGECFACKTFDIRSMADPSLQKKVGDMLRHEIEMLRSLDHPNVVRAYESIESDDGCIHIIMELCEGGDLSARKYTEADAAKIVCKILRAIMYCHRHLVCHRDLKFENILWEAPGKGAEGEPKLIDFGMSREFAAGVLMRERVGTVYTMAPEVLRGEYTQMADIWSIGCVAFQLITGIPAFECETEIETVKRLQAVNYSWPNGKNISPEAKEFVYKLLKYDPNKRATAQEALNSPWISAHIAEVEVDMSEKTNISTRTLRSMRDYSTFGPFKKTALMILAYNLKPQELGDIRAEFAKYDTEERGSIKQEELRTVLIGHGVTDPEIQLLFKSMDMDHTGKIRYLEFLAATLGAMDETWLNETKLRDVFQCMDVDNSGFIDFKNLKTLLGKDYKPEVVVQMLEEAKCQPGTEGVTFDQFLNLMQASSDSLIRLETDQSRNDEQTKAHIKNLRLFNRSRHKGRSLSPLPPHKEEQEVEEPQKICSESKDSFNKVLVPAE